MGKRYYCDFCHKSIPADPENRKKHNEGVSHLANRAAYYSNYKDLASILLEEREKKPCIKYLNSGYCGFGELCRNSHRTPSQVAHLESLYRIECHNKAKEYEERVNEEKKAEKRKHDGQASSRVECLVTDFLTTQAEKDLEKFMPKYELPGKLKAYDSRLLPPSLIPPTFKDLINYPFSQFG